MIIRNILVQVGMAQHQVIQARALNPHQKVVVLESGVVVAVEVVSVVVAVSAVALEV